MTASSHKPGRRVLVVDDHLAICLVIRALLQQRGCDVVFASSGDDAIRQLEAEACDIAIVDWYMPVVGGEAVLEHIAAHHAHLLPRTIVMSGSYSEAEMLCKRFKCSLLRKPFDARRFYNVFDAVLQSKEAGSLT